MAVGADAMPETAPMMEAMTARRRSRSPAAGCAGAQHDRQRAGRRRRAAAAPQPPGAGAWRPVRRSAAAGRRGAGAPAAEAPRPSLFSTVTGAFRRRSLRPAATSGARSAGQRAEPMLQEPRHRAAATRLGAADRRRMKWRGSISRRSCAANRRSLRLVQETSLRPPWTGEQAKRMAAVRTFMFRIAHLCAAIKVAKSTAYTEILRNND